MNRIARYIVYIFLGFLFSLIGLFELSHLFAPSDAMKAKQIQAGTAVPVALADGGSPTPTPDPAARMVQLARAEVNKLTGFPAEKVYVESQTQVEWPSSALGCGKPGFLYTQVLTPGYQIILTTPSERFEFHSNMTDDVLLCSAKQLDQ